MRLLRGARNDRLVIQVSARSVSDVAISLRC